MPSKLRARLSFANVAAAIALCVAIGGGTAIALPSDSTTQQTVAFGATVRGAIGGDYHAFDASASDFGAVASLPLKARQRLRDTRVSVDVSHWGNAGGQTAPTTTDNNPDCTGAPNNPTAPTGEVCIYVSGADHAFNLKGNAVLFGTQGSFYGFKLNWDASTSGDTFVDATWAYTAE
jgi:hypothetical protein